MNKKRFIESVISFFLIAYSPDTIGQNNPIFTGGTGDGSSKTSAAQSGENIFSGGVGDGFGLLDFSQNGIAIFKGSAGDGWSTVNRIPSADMIFMGGNGDGWNALQTSRPNVDLFFSGGNGDGWNGLNKTPVITDNFFSGSTGDGWNSLQSAKPLVDSIFTGGISDGWASTYRPNTPLPVTLLYFNAQKKEESKSLLTWETSSEMNSAWFDVERSSDAMNFSPIGRVKAAGNSSTPVKYSFIDPAPLKGANFYRLKQVDLDAKYQYSPARSLVFGDRIKAELQCYPNPTTGKFKLVVPVNTATERCVVNIFNINGIVVKQIRLEMGYYNPVEVDLSAQAKGIYIVQAVAAGKYWMERIILQ